MTHPTPRRRRIVAFACTVALVITTVTTANAVTLNDPLKIAFDATNVYDRAGQQTTTLLVNNDPEWSNPAYTGCVTEWRGSERISARNMLDGSWEAEGDTLLIQWPAGGLRSGATLTYGDARSAGYNDNDQYQVALYNGRSCENLAGYHPTVIAGIIIGVTPARIGVSTTEVGRGESVTITLENVSAAYMMCIFVAGEQDCSLTNEEESYTATISWEEWNTEIGVDEALILRLYESYLWPNFDEPGGEFPTIDSEYLESVEIRFSQTPTPAELTDVPGRVAPARRFPMLLDVGYPKAVLRTTTPKVCAVIPGREAVSDVLTLASGICTLVVKVNGTVARTRRFTVAANGAAFGEAVFREILLFQPNSAKLSPEAKSALRELIPTLYFVSYIAVVGHTANTGSSNQAGSERIALARAKAVQAFLREEGITVNIKISAGRRQPASVNPVQNRRAEILWVV